MDIKTKWGIDQVNRPAPLWYRRLTNAMLVCFLPAYVGIVQSLTMSDKARNLCMIIATTFPFLLKGIGMIIGNGQFYSPSNDTIDNQKKEEKNET